MAHLARCRASLLGLLIIVLLSGCGATVPPAEVRDEGYDCGFHGDAYSLTWDVNPRAGSMPRGFEPFKAVWCKTPDVPSDGSVPEFTVTEYQTTNVAPIIKRFATPDAPANVAADCAASHILDSIPARVWLVDEEGRAVLGHSPMDVCGPNNIGLDAFTI